MVCFLCVKKASLVGAFFMPAFFAAQVQAQIQPQAFCSASEQLTYVSVKRVVDGDTLRLVDGRSVRLIGINTPELGHKGQTAEPFAVAAQRRLQDLLDASDGRVGLQYGAQRHDRYGRTLAHVFDGAGRNIEAQLLASGLGYQIAIAPNLALLDCQLAAQQFAREQGAGVWRQPVLQAPEELTRGGFRQIKVRVRKVQINAQGAWLELGAAVIRIDGQALKSFKRESLEGYVGREVIARGWVVDRASRGRNKVGRARWMLILTHPTMIETLPSVKTTL